MLWMNLFLFIQRYSKSSIIEQLSMDNFENIDSTNYNQEQKKEKIIKQK